MSDNDRFVPQGIAKKALFSELPSEWPISCLPEIQAMVQESGRKVVVLDDDPTGTQTVYDIPVLTSWSQEELAEELSNDISGFYILTNSRSLTQKKACALNFKIGHNLHRASISSGKAFVIVSRSDSTLRGHFPAEVDVLYDVHGHSFDGCLIIPFFLEGGRYTVNNVHYVAEGEEIVPAAETEFAHDKDFGYCSSDLLEWVAEKTGGRISAKSVSSISINEIRLQGPEGVFKSLMSLVNGKMCIVNAVAYSDIEVFVLGLLKAETAGKKFLYRTAASFVKTRLGLPGKPLIRPLEIVDSTKNGGLLLVGSYVPKTTNQLKRLKGQKNIHFIEADVPKLLDPEKSIEEIDRISSELGTYIESGITVVVSTSRELIKSDDAEQSLLIGSKISNALVSIVQILGVRPRYILSKGGITSSDIATRGLKVRRAIVKGQILPGVPVWTLGEETKYPGLTYIIFPGNVGNEEALINLVKSFS